MIAIIFLCVMKSHLFAMFVWNFTTTSLSIAEILLFIKRWSKIAVSNICQLTRIRDVNHLKERLIEEWCDLHYNIHLCGSESVAYSSASLRAYWWRALWTSVVTATATVTDFYRLNWYVLETCVLSVFVLEDKKYHNTGNAVHWNFTRSA